MSAKLPRRLLGALLRCLFRLEVRGLEHFKALEGQSAVIIANHQSFLDPLLLAVFLPDKPAFAMNVHQAKKWYFRPLLALVEVFLVDPMQPMSTKGIIKRLKEGEKVVVFPEGRITTSGGVMKVYEGTGLVIDRTQAMVLPVRVEGAQYSRLSRLDGKVRQRWFPRISITVLPPRRLELPAEMFGKKRRALAASRVYDMLTDSGFGASRRQETLLAALAAASRQHDMHRNIATDATRAELSYHKLWTRAFALSNVLGREAGDWNTVGMLLPTSLAALVTFLALHLQGRVPAMLNYSAGARSLLAACDMAEVRTVVTARAFIEKARLQEVIEALKVSTRILYLEDLRQNIRFSDRLEALLSASAPEQSLSSMPCRVATPGEPAVILFTSGSEGMPKGVALSHENILSNIRQVAACIGFTEADIMLNAMPVFHSFGLTVGTILPLVLGIRVVMYPNPLHYRIVPEMCYDSRATILLGTDTFLNGYARGAHPYDFHNVRLAVAGAEKLKETTRRLYADRFGLRILEGYGVTETSPVIAVNTPLQHKAGTVGRALPGIGLKLEPVEGIERGGRLMVSGPNVMLGYLKHDQPGVIQPQGEWYDTGDIVDVDAEGYISILGRAKRFAKVGGEMVSLAAVEEFAASLWPDQGHAALALPDPRKGEHIVLLTERQDAAREALVQHAKAEGVSDLMVPRKVTFMEKLPRLSTGKIDYLPLKEMFKLG